MLISVGIVEKILYANVGVQYFFCVMDILSVIFCL